MSDALQTVARGPMYEQVIERPRGARRQRRADRWQPTTGPARPLGAAVTYLRRQVRSRTTSHVTEKGSSTAERYPGTNQPGTDLYAAHETRARFDAAYASASRSR